MEFFTYGNGAINTAFVTTTTPIPNALPMSLDYGAPKYTTGTMTLNGDPTQVPGILLQTTVAIQMLAETADDGFSIARIMIRPFFLGNASLHYTSYVITYALPTAINPPILRPYARIRNSGQPNPQGAARISANGQNIELTIYGNMGSIISDEIIALC